MITRGLRVGPFDVRFDFPADLAEVLDGAVLGLATMGDAVAYRVEWLRARREPARRRGLVVQGTFGTGKWCVRHAGRFTRWEARGVGLDHARVFVALTGDGVEDGYIVRSFLRFFLAETLARTGGVALHAGAVARPEGAAVFMARSGEGKTTLVRCFGQDAGLGDDFVLVTQVDGLYHVFPSPVAGREGTPVLGGPAPLWRLCEMEKASATEVEKVSQKDQVAAILRHVVLFTKDLAVRRRLLDTVVSLVQKVGVVRLRQCLTIPPWEVLRDVAL